MTWSSTAPDGTKSVKQNRVILGNNNSYIETTMGNDPVGTNNAGTRDHFWDVGGDEDGHHRFIKSPAFTVGGVATDPLVGTGMDGVLYLKSDGLTPSSVEGFYRNASNVYQFIPAFKSGTVSITSSSTFESITTIPPLSYGEIFLYKSTSGRYTAQWGYFKSTATITEAWGPLVTVQGFNADNPTEVLKFANGSNATDLNVKARLRDGTSGTWNYRLTYRAL